MWITRSRIAWCWTLLIFVACWTPRQLVPEEPDLAKPFLVANFDKLIHFLLFAGFSFWWLATGRIKARWIVVAGVAATALSEFGQLAPIVSRDATWPDAWADLIGLVGGLVAGLVVEALLPRLWRPARQLEPSGEQVTPEP